MIVFVFSILHVRFFFACTKQPGMIFLMREVYGGYYFIGVTAQGFPNPELYMMFEETTKRNEVFFFFFFFFLELICLFYPEPSYCE